MKNKNIEQSNFDTKKEKEKIEKIYTVKINPHEKGEPFFVKISPEELDKLTDSIKGSKNDAGGKAYKRDVDHDSLQIFISTDPGYGDAEFIGSLQKHEVFQCKDCNEWKDDSENRGGLKICKTCFNKEK